MQQELSILRVGEVRIATDLSEPAIARVIRQIEREDLELARKKASAQNGRKNRPKN